jgi:hypothetical protein
MANNKKPQPISNQFNIFKKLKTAMTQIKASRPSASIATVASIPTVATTLAVATNQVYRDIPGKAVKKVNQLQDKYTTLYNETKANLDIYETNRNNSLNLFDSYNNYVSENKKLKKQVENTNTDIQTNDRKTFYEDEATETLNLYYSILLGLYIIIVFSFGVCWFVFPSTSTNPKILFLFICLILYPIFSTRILQYIMYLYNLLLDFLPKSAFLPKR